MSAVPDDDLISIEKLAKKADISKSKAWDLTNENSPRFDCRAPRRVPLGGSTRFSLSEANVWVDMLKKGRK